MASMHPTTTVVYGETPPVPSAAVSDAKSASAAGKVASKSEKRRLAALKTWEKRRMKQGTAAARQAANVPTTDAVAVVPDAVGSSPQDVALCIKVPAKSSNQRLSALKTREKRVGTKGILPPEPLPVVSPFEGDNNVSSVHEGIGDLPQDSQARISTSESISNKRRLAALKSWEKRRKRKSKAAVKPDPVISAPVQCTSTYDEGDATDAPVNTNGYRRKHKKGYTAELRSQAAKAAWEKRKRKLQSTAVSSPSHDVTDDTSEEDSAIVSRQAKPKPKKQQRSNNSQEPKIVKSRSRRTSYEVGNITDSSTPNEVITRLRRHHGWMEFHPSSRYGNGTADYAYIPGSLAVLIRNGAFSKPIVMEHGILGIHYALDYNGYGGLKEMMDTFGEDYAPFPSDAMMKASIGLQEKKFSKIEKWDLGEDLPWKDVSKQIDESVNRKSVEQQSIEPQEAVDADVSTVIPEDIEEVADILASLYEVNSSTTTPQDRPSTEASTNTTSYVQKTSTNAPKANVKPVISPSLHALCGYESDSSEDEDDESVEFIQTSNQVSQLQNYEAANLKSDDAPTAEAPAEAPSGMFGIPLVSQQQEVAPYPCNGCYQDSSEDCGMFGAPLYNSEQVSNYHYPSNEYVQQSSDGIHFIRNNQEVMLLAPLDEM